MAKAQMQHETQGRPAEQAVASNTTNAQRSANGAARQTGRNAQARIEQARQGWSQGLSEEQLARGLGWFSIGLGLAEVLAPRGLGRLIGVRGDHTGLFRFLGLREIAAGVGVLAQQRPVAPMWSRVGGDAMDLALLGAALASPKSDHGKLIAATLAVAGVTALDVICAQQLSQPAGKTKGGAMQVKHAVTINRSAEELYRFWRDFQNLPRFMRHLESVQTVDQASSQAAGQATAQTAGQAGQVGQVGQVGLTGGSHGGGRRSHWVAKAPAGQTVEWDAEIIEDRPNELIAWRSLEGADIDNAGNVRFERAPGGRGTVVTVDLVYNPPAGVIGATIAKLFGEEPEWQVKDDLRRFKQVMETGEVITIEGQPAGRDSSTSWKYDTAIRD